MITTLFLIFFSSSLFAHNYGSQEMPLPFDGDEFSTTAVSYEVVDWRNREGVNWLGPVRDQANCGSCVAFATIATLEDQVTISSKLLWKKEAYSQEALFSCGKSKCSTGWNVHTAALMVEKIGVVDVACAPYKAGASGIVPACGNFCENQTQRTLKIQSLTHPVGAAAVKEALKSGPLMTSMTVKSGFDSYTEGIFKSSMDEEAMGGHAVELVGYNDLERYWVIKNSWGEFWGEQGYARISYDDAQGVGNNVFGFNVNADTEGFVSPSEDEYVRGKFQIKGKLGSVEIKKAGTLLSTLDCSKGCEVDSTKLADGEYSLQYLSSKGLLQTRKITVLNKTLSTEMTISSPRSFNYEYPQSGRIYFDVNLSGELFPEAIVMEIKKGAVVMNRRVFKDVYSFNRLGFNTYTLSNGNYEVSITHKTFEKSSAPHVTKVIFKN